MNKQVQNLDQPVVHKRRNYLVNPSFQLPFLFYLSFAIMFGLFVIYLSNLWYFETIISQGREIGLDPDHPYYLFIEDQRILLKKTYLIVCTVTFVALMVLGLLLSHHIAGPLHCIKNHMIRISQGEFDIQPVRLRNRDFFVDVADCLNEMVLALRSNETSQIASTSEETRQK
ncbi:MAG: methyl-accepting chemotaxis protein [Gammaproteobacteria bacterium]|jgi:hypothetical protein|nr:methyl-accepting chemotaxis protein [Gammaproteobacteria bacterium]MBT4493816.1 methyl-accepting chemotaxis protein [Gammaproteobacteria bacterium]